MLPDRPDRRVVRTTLLCSKRPDALSLLHDSYKIRKLTLKIFFYILKDLINLTSIEGSQKNKTLAQKSY